MALVDATMPWTTEDSAIWFPILNMECISHGIMVVLAPFRDTKQARTRSGVRKHNGSKLPNNAAIHCVSQGEGYVRHHLGSHNTDIVIILMVVAFGIVKGSTKAQRGIGTAYSLLMVYIEIMMKDREPLKRQRQQRLIAPPSFLKSALPSLKEVGGGGRPETLRKKNGFSIPMVSMNYHRWVEESLA